MSGIKDWNGYNAALRDSGKTLRALHPEIVKGFVALNNGAAQTKHLDAKTRELISLAVTVTTRCDGCIDAHVRKAKAAGATKEEIVETLAMAIYMGAGPSAMYASHAFNAYTQFAEARAAKATAGE